MLKIKVVSVKPKTENNNTIAFPSEIREHYNEEKKKKEYAGFLDRQLRCAELVLKALDDLVDLPNGVVCLKKDIGLHGYKIVGTEISQEEEISV